jgi:hypothetical protein
VFIGFCIAIDISAIYNMLILDDGLPRDWGVVGRLAMPFIFYLVGWKSEEKNKKFTLYLIGTSRLVYYNSIMVRSNLNLVIAAMSVALLMDILAFYQAVTFFKKSAVINEKIIVKPWVLLFTFGVSMIIVILLFFLFK